MSDEYAETDEWPLPRYTGSSKVPATFHPSETPTVTRGPEWRDRGLIIAAQQTRIAQLELEVLDLRTTLSEAPCEHQNGGYLQMLRLLREANAKLAKVESLAKNSGDLDNGILVWDLQKALS